MPAVISSVEQLLSWYRLAARDLPWRRKPDIYGVWISEIMLQQTQVSTVLPYWRRWMDRFPCVTSVAKASLNDILKCWEGLGYYSRAKNLHRTAQIVVEQYSGRFPEDHKLLLSLPGIGRYTAGAICSIALNQPHPILDGNVTRLLTRMHGIRQNVKESPIQEQLWKLALAYVITAKNLEPNSGPALINQALMELGALVCTPRHPKCTDCPVHRHCAARRKNVVNAIPNLGARQHSTARHFAAFILKKREKFALTKRPAAGVNGDLWEFPSTELNKGQSLVDAAADLFGQKPLALTPRVIIKHTITRYRITLQALDLSLPKPPRRLGHLQFFSLQEMDQLPLTSAHRKIATHLARTYPFPLSQRL